MSEIGARLARLRGDILADLETIARWARVSPTRLAEIEAGTGTIGATEFERICRALGVDASALYAGQESSPTRSVARFRSAWGHEAPLKPADYRLLASASEVGRALGDLLARLGRQPPLVQHRRTTALSSVQEPWEQGYSLGDAARSALTRPSEVIYSVESLLNVWGVHIVTVQFSTALIEAASLWEAGAMPVILLNRQASRVAYNLSRRAVLCHELCHLLHDAGEGEIATRTSWAEGSRSHNDGIEKRAGGFAPSFLAPRREVTRWFEQGEGSTGKEPRAIVLELANRWGLSYEGAVWHAKNCGLISSAESDVKVRRQTPRSGEVIPEPFEQVVKAPPPAMINSRLPDRVGAVMEGSGIHIVLEALEKDVITAGRAREILESA